MSGDLEQFGAGAVEYPERSKPSAATSQNIGNTGDALNVIDRCRRTIDPAGRRKRRLEAGHAFFALDALQKRRFLTANVSTGTVVHDDVEVPAVDVVLTDQLCGIGLIDRCLQMLALAHELAAYIDEGRMRSYGEGGEQNALNQQMRVVAYDFPVLAGARLALVRIDHEIGWAGIVFRHKRPLEAGGETCPATPPEPRGLHLVDDPVMTLFD